MRHWAPESEIRKEKIAKAAINRQEIRCLYTTGFPLTMKFFFGLGACKQSNSLTNSKTRSFGKRSLIKNISLGAWRCCTTIKHRKRLFVTHLPRYKRKNPASLYLWLLLTPGADPPVPKRAGQMLLLSVGKNFKNNSLLQEKRPYSYDEKEISSYVTISLFFVSLLYKLCRSQVLCEQLFLSLFSYACFGQLRLRYR